MSNTARILRSSRREALFTAAVWILACGWTVGYSAFAGYRADPNPQFVAGMPAWVAWGIVAPWVLCTVVTVWYAFFGIRDEDLGEEHAPGEGLAGE
ncbi:MAG: DUF997 family protein [Armatimonadota bacterium]